MLKIDLIVCALSRFVKILIVAKLLLRYDAVVKRSLFEAFLLNVVKEVV